MNDIIKQVMLFIMIYSSIVNYFLRYCE